MSDHVGSVMSAFGVVENVGVAVEVSLRRPLAMLVLAPLLLSSDRPVDKNVAFAVYHGIRK